MYNLLYTSNLFEWTVTILGPPDTLYEGGFFNAILKFPKDYPQSPPECRFTSEMWHPNGEYSSIWLLLGCLACLICDFGRFQEWTELKYISSPSMSPPAPSHSLSPCSLPLLKYHSVPRRQGVHFNPTSPGLRPFESSRGCLGTLVSGPYCRKYCPFNHIDALFAKWRIPSKHRCSKGLAWK